MVNKNKVCMAASSGGHLTQILKVTDCFENYEKILVTTSEVVKDKLLEIGDVYCIGESNHDHPIKCLKVMIHCLKILIKERPGIIISTGAAGGCMMCLLGKVCGAKVIWIDSITNVKRLSLSGRIVRNFADLFLVQWPELSEKYKRTEYAGCLV